MKAQPGGVIRFTTCGSVESTSLRPLCTAPAARRQQRVAHLRVLLRRTLVGVAAGVERVHPVADPPSAASSALDDMAAATAARGVANEIQIVSSSPEK